MKKLVPQMAGMSLLGTRQEQQDSFGIIQEKDRGIAVVCDGMGGLSFGQQASQGAVSILLERYHNKPKECPFPDFFQESLEYMDEYVYKLGRSGTQGRSGTTVVAVAIEEGKLYWLSVGDSRLYLLRQGALLCATQDHNYRLLLDQRREQGTISPQEYEREMERGNALVSYIGMKGISLMDGNPSPFLLQAQDTLMLMSDGVYRVLSKDASRTFGESSGSASELARHLCERVEQESRPNQDNATVIAIRIEEEQGNEADKMQQ